MERQITWTNNGIGIIEAEKRQGIAPAFLAEEVVEKIAAFHSSVPGYAVTPLAELSARAKELGLGNIFVKDESHRFGLNAFKGLGGVYAVSKVICEKLGLDLEKADFSQICSEEKRKKSKIWYSSRPPMATTEKALLGRRRNSAVRLMFICPKALWNAVSRQSVT